METRNRQITGGHHRVSLVPMSVSTEYGVQSYKTQEIQGPCPLPNRKPELPRESFRRITNPLFKLSKLVLVQAQLIRFRSPRASTTARAPSTPRLRLVRHGAFLSNPAERGVKTPRSGPGTTTLEDAHASKSPKLSRHGLEFSMHSLI